MDDLPIQRRSPTHVLSGRDVDWLCWSDQCRYHYAMLPPLLYWIVLNAYFRISYCLLMIIIDAHWLACLGWRLYGRWRSTYRRWDSCYFRSWRLLVHPATGTTLSSRTACSATLDSLVCMLYLLINLSLSAWNCQKISYLCCITICYNVVTFF